MKNISTCQTNTKGLSFSRWLRCQQTRNDPVGDLAADVCYDPTWPRGRKLETFLKHLEQKDACFGATDALQRAWREFEGSKKPRRVYVKGVDGHGREKMYHMFPSAGR